MDNIKIPKTSKQRQAEWRARKKGLVPVCVYLPPDVHQRLTYLVESQCATQQQIIEQLIDAAFGLSNCD